MSRTRMGHAFACLHAHIVWATRNREPVLRAVVRDRLYGYIHGIVAGEGGGLLKAGGTADRVHLLVEMKPDTAIATLVRKIKANSSKWVHETYPDLRSFSWQEGYGAVRTAEEGSAAGIDAAPVTSS